MASPTAILIHECLSPTAALNPGQPMSINLSIHAVALLNICDYSVRNGNKTPEFVGALFGQVKEREIIINHTFELIRTDSGIDMQFLYEKADQYSTVYQDQRLIGWYIVGSTGTEPWVDEIQQQVSQVVDSPILGVFNVPFEAEMGVLPFKIYNAQHQELQVQMKVDEIEQIALKDILSTHGRKNNLNTQLINETRALLLFHRNLAQIQAALDKDDLDPRRQAEIVSTIQQLCRTHDFADAQEIKDAEKDVLSLLISGLIARGDALAFS